MTDWNDPSLADLRRTHIETLQAWSEVASDPSADSPDGLDDEQRRRMDLARVAEDAYIGKMRDLGLMT